MLSALTMADAIIKLDPMVRKLETTISEFKMALDNNDLVSAQQLLRAISQTSDFLAEDVTSIHKSETEADVTLGVNDIYAGGVPVMQFKDQGSIIKGDRPMGYIGPDGIQSDWKPQHGFGQRVD
tara:strand:- start:132 stop:503 length:372 start_codon:yes stop_codon:yes gene_type:complete